MDKYLAKFVFTALSIISLWVVERPMNWIAYGLCMSMFFFIFVIEEIMRVK